MGFFDLFKTKRQTKTETWQEFGSYRSQFPSFSGDIYSMSIVRSCVRPLAEMTSKASCKSSDKQLERLLNNRPNMYMNGAEFLKKIRTMYEIRNNVFIYIVRDNRGRVESLYPVPYMSLTALDYNGKLYIDFAFVNQTKPHLVASWDDLIVLRKDYYMSDIAGESNTVLIPDLELSQTTMKGLENAVKATANLRGILKNTKSMLSDDDVKKRQQQFVKDYMNLENEGGIASIDATQEFTPISMSPIVTTYTQMKEIRENIYKYFGVNNDVLMGNMTPDKLDVFCELKILPFLIDLSEELTSKIYTGKALAYDNYVVYGIDKLQFMSLTAKLSMNALVEKGIITPNEYRALIGLDPFEGGDTFRMRLDTAEIDKGTDEEQTEETQEGEENGNQEG